MTEVVTTAMATSSSLLTILAGIGAIISGAAAAYITTRMKNLATRADAQQIQLTLKENAVAIKAIETEFSRADYLMKSELAFRERQLSILYGPVYGYLKSQQKIYDLWIDNKLVHKNFTVKKLFKEQNEKIRGIIINNSHLLDDSRMQDYVMNFLTSSMIFDWYAAEHDAGEVPHELTKYDSVKFPVDFRDHIYTTTERLMARIQSLNARFAMPLDGLEK